MTEYTFRQEVLTDGDEIEIKDSAREIEFHPKDGATIVTWFEKKGESIR